MHRCYYMSRLMFSSMESPSKNKNLCFGEQIFKCRLKNPSPGCSTLRVPIHEDPQPLKIQCPLLVQVMSIQYLPKDYVHIF